MVLHRLEQLTSRRHLPSWALLAFAAGATNAGAFLACKRFVAHVTGTVTLIGIDAGTVLALDYALVLGAFMTGAAAAIFLARAPARPSLESPPAYWLPLALVSSILALVALTGRLGAFGAFGGTVETAHDFALLAVLGFAMGLQNAAVAASTAMAVRTTHMTGHATDLAIAFAMASSDREDERAAAQRSIRLRGTKLLAFVAGAIAMSATCARVGFLGFLLPAAACAAATLSSYLPQPRENHALRQHPQS